MNFPASGVLRFSFLFLFFMNVFQFLKTSTLFTGPTTILLKKKIKNESHDTIHTFKNYFVTVFSVFGKINCI